MLALALAPVVSAAVARVIGVPLLRLRGHYLAFATLAFAPDRLVAPLRAGPVHRRAVRGDRGEAARGRRSPVTGATHAAVVWALVGVALLLSANLVHSRAGRALQAIAANEPAAARRGQRRDDQAAPVRLRGCARRARRRAVRLLGPVRRPEDFAIVLSLLFVVMVSMGGLGNIYGAVVGAVTVVYVDHKLRDLGTHESLLGWDLPARPDRSSRSASSAPARSLIMIFFPHGLLPAVLGRVAAVRRRIPSSR